MYCLCSVTIHQLRSAWLAIKRKRWRRRKDKENDRIVSSTYPNGEVRRLISGHVQVHFGRLPRRNVARSAGVHYRAKPENLVFRIGRKSKEIERKHEYQPVRKFLLYGHAFCLALSSDRQTNHVKVEGKLDRNESARAEWVRRGRSLTARLSCRARLHAKPHVFATVVA